MTIEKLNEALRNKMSEELEKYKNRLLTLPPAEILEQASEYDAKQNILLAMESYTPTYAEVRVLLNSPTPLEDIYKEYRDRDHSVVNEILDCVEGFAHCEIIYQKAIPVYNHSGIYARQNDELDLYRESRNANFACRDAIDYAISNHYSDNILSDEAVTEVVDAFSVERIAYVLANTIQRQDWDRRYSSSNRAWANTIDVCENRDDFNGDKRLEFTLRSHPGLINIFVNEFRKLV